MNSTYKINPNIIWKEVDGVIYIMNPEREEIHALNETGSLIWKLISEGKLPTQVTAVFTSRYKVTKQQALKDIQEFIDHYVKEEFVTLKST